ncbi:MAG TPA: AAA family ATPase [Candidatus Eremiobacteraceae bacterium]|nr:AAA family ATPase [Candidatus Eremiobacteraceae bacterium]
MDNDAVTKQATSRASELLFGRDAELRILEQRLDSIGEHGSALLFHGDPGVGKTAVLAAAKMLASKKRFLVLSIAGVQTETNLPFAGLYELVRPLLDKMERLPKAQQNALRAAFGLVERSSADHFVVALGALDLLAEAASERPLLLLVDDVQWLDQSSTAVLAFIARRLESEPIFMLVGNRDPDGTPLDRIIPKLRLDALDDLAASALLHAHYSELPALLRDKVLREAAGNPLALVELPKAITSDSYGGLLPEPLPLTTRLEDAFASRISELPLSTRHLLLAAALDEQSNLAEIMSVATLLSGEELPLEVLTPATRAGLLTVDSMDVRFKHPLMRSAVHNAASLAERVAAHSALATVLRNDADRRAWHRAAATVGPDDTVAEELEAAAIRAQQRGDVPVAVQALDRATELSADPARRARCLLKGVELAFDIGWRDVVVRLLQRAATLKVPPRDRFRLMWYGEALSRSISGSQALSEIADNIKRSDDVDLALDLLSGPATYGWWAEPDEQVCNKVIAAVERARISSQEDSRFLLILAMTAPIDRGASVVASLKRLAKNADGNPRAAYLLGMAATQVGEFDLVERFFTIAASGFRSDGRLALLTHVLVLRAWSAIYLGNRNASIANAEEGLRLATETDQTIYVALAQAAVAMLAALRGEHDSAEALADEAERASLRIGTVVAEIQMVRGVNALTAQRYADAYSHLHRMFDRSDSAYHPMRQYFFIGDLVEAAIQSGHRDEANVILADVEDVARRTPSSQLHQALQYARAILVADDDPDRERLFEGALSEGVIRSPFTLARIRLAYGAWLRRARRLKDARSPLRAAMEAFDMYDAFPWSERARKELRSTGISVEGRTPELRDRLTPQELQIALMAATGLSNREIGQKLFLSHRTVGSHLYRIFPKLNITTRFQLRDVLADGGAQNADAT